MAPVTSGMCDAGHRLFAALHLGCLAKAYRKADRLEEALTTVEGALAESEVNGQRFDDAELHRTRGRVLAALGRTEEAAESLRHAVEVAAAQSAGLFRARAESALGRLP